MQLGCFHLSFSEAAPHIDCTSHAFLSQIVQVHIVQKVQKKVTFVHTLAVLELIHIFEQLFTYDSVYVVKLAKVLWIKIGVTVWINMVAEVKVINRILHPVSQIFCCVIPHQSQMVLPISGQVANVVIDWG